MGPHILHSLLLEQAHSAPSLKEAELTLLTLPSALVARIARRKEEGYVPFEKEVYAELKKMMLEK